MKVLGYILVGLIVGISLSYIGLGVWAEWKHDKSALQYIQDEIQEYKDKKKATNDSTVDEEVEVEIEDGTATAIVSFNL